MNAIVKIPSGRISPPQAGPPPAAGIAVLTFAVSWFLKGSELFNILLVEHGRPPVLRESAANEPAVTKQAPAIDAGKEQG